MIHKIKILLFTIIPAFFIIFFYQNLTTIADVPRFKIIWGIGFQIEEIISSSTPSAFIDLTKSRVDGYYVTSTGASGPLSFWPTRPIHCALNYKKLIRMKNLDPSSNPTFRVNGKDYDVTFMNNSYGPNNPNNCERLRCEYIKSELRKRFPNDSTNCSAAQQIITPADVAAQDPDSDDSDELDMAFLESANQQGTETQEYRRFRMQLFGRTFRELMTKLNISGEINNSVNPKSLISQMLLSTTQMQYHYDANANTERIEILSNPGTFGELYNLNLRSSAVMAYQEPYMQAKDNKLLLVPLELGGPTTGLRGQICLVCLPYNVRIVDLLGEGLEAEAIQPPQFFVNSRVWNDEKDPARFLAASQNLTYFKGLNLETGPNKRIDRLDSNIRSIAFMLYQTNKDVTLLIPTGYGTATDRVDTEQSRDLNAINAFNTFMYDVSRKLNDVLRTQYGIKIKSNAICNPRISIIVGGYGNPVHPRTFPINRVDANGNFVRRAGTIGGRIAELHQRRQEFCKPNAVIH